MARPERSAHREKAVRGGRTLRSSPDTDAETWQEQRRQIPARIPFVIVSLNDNDMPEFRMFDGI